MIGNNNAPKFPVVPNPFMPSSSSTSPSNDQPYPTAAEQSQSDERRLETGSAQPTNSTAAERTDLSPAENANPSTVDPTNPRPAGGMDITPSDAANTTPADRTNPTLAEGRNPNPTPTDHTNPTPADHTDPAPADSAAKPANSAAAGDDLIPADVAAKDASLETDIIAQQDPAVLHPDRSHLNYDTKTGKGFALEMETHAMVAATKVGLLPPNTGVDRDAMLRGDHISNANRELFEKVKQQPDATKKMMQQQEADGNEEDKMLGKTKDEIKDSGADASAAAAAGAGTDGPKCDEAQVGEKTDSGATRAKHDAQAGETKESNTDEARRDGAQVREE